MTNSEQHAPNRPKGVHVFFVIAGVLALSCLTLFLIIGGPFGDDDADPITTVTMTPTENSSVNSSVMTSPPTIIESSTATAAIPGTSPQIPEPTNTIERR